MNDKNPNQEKHVGSEGLALGRDMWYRELNFNSAGMTLRIDRVLESTRSEFQTIDVIENTTFGKLLVLYGSLMVCDKDNNSYNEMITHIPLFAHPSPKRVLIIGGGDCGAVTEVVKHPEVEKVTMCEIDSKVVEVSKKHFPYLTAGLDDPRAELTFRDGKVFIENTDEKFDIIILDLSDPVGPAADLFQKAFHQKVHDRLNPDGILVAQAESPLFNQDILKKMYGNLAEIFPVTRLYNCVMPIYPSGMWAFAFCSKKYDPLADFDEARYDRLKLQTRYYNKETHRAAFALPQFLKTLIEK